MENRKLDLVFIDRNGKVCPIDDVSRAELAEGLAMISRDRKETAIGERTKVKPTVFSFFQFQGVTLRFHLMLFVRVLVGAGFSYSSAQAPPFSPSVCTFDLPKTINVLADYALIEV